ALQSRGPSQRRPRPPRRRRLSPARTPSRSGSPDDGPPPGPLVRAPARAARPGLSCLRPPAATSGGDERLLALPRQPLDPVLLPQSLAPARDLAGPGEDDGKPRSRVA